MLSRRYFFGPIEDISSKLAPNLLSACTCWPASPRGAGSQGLN